MDEKVEMDDVAQLKKRVKELEGQLKSKRKTEDKAGEKLGDALSDAIRTWNKESARYARAWALAYTEGLRLASHSVTAMANEIQHQQVQDEETQKESSASDLLWSFPSHAASGYARAIEESVDIPRKVINKFYDVYSSKEA
jgi:hypothetical protein